jgi:competence protein ComFB
MIDYTWQNPYFIVESTRGHFTFLPRPERAEETGDLQAFSFEVCIETEGFTPLQHFFELKVTAEGEVRHNFSAQHTYKIGELYLFPEDVPMERNE